MIITINMLSLSQLISNTSQEKFAKTKMRLAFLQLRTTLNVKIQHSSTFVQRNSHDDKV